MQNVRTLKAARVGRGLLLWTAIKRVTMCAILIGVAANVYSQSPPLINYQGRLTDAGGKGFSGTVKLDVRIYDSATTGTAVWGPQTFNTVPVFEGQFNIILGDKDEASPQRSIADAFGDSLRFLAVKILAKDGVSVVNPQDIAPRQQILSVPYALNAAGSLLSGFKLETGLTEAAAKDKVVQVKSRTNEVELAIDAPGQEGRTRGIYRGNGVVQVSGVVDLPNNTPPVLKDTVYYLSDATSGTLVTYPAILTDPATLAKPYGLMIGRGIAANRLQLDIHAESLLDSLFIANLDLGNQVQEPTFPQNPYTVGGPWSSKGSSTGWDSNGSAATCRPGQLNSIYLNTSTKSYVYQVIEIPERLYPLINANGLKVEAGAVFKVTSGTSGAVFTLEFLEEYQPSDVPSGESWEQTFGTGDHCELALAKYCIPPRTKYLRVGLGDVSGAAYWSEVWINYRLSVPNECP